MWFEAVNFEKTWYKKRKMYVAQKKLLHRNDDRSNALFMSF